MISVKALSIGPIATNCYIVHDEDAHAFVIDPGCDVQPILDAVQGLTIVGILLTHAHWDHMGGVLPLAEASGAPVWVHEAEREWLTDPELNLSQGSRFAPGPVVARPPDHTYRGGETLHLLGERIEVRHTPGHSPGHVSFVMGDLVFGGDALFAGSVGRTDLPGGDHDQLIESIRRHLLSLPDATTVLPGHGPATTIERERKSNPFLQFGE